MVRPKPAPDRPEVLQGELLCHRCNQRTPVHMLWFKVRPSTVEAFTVGQVVCDDCLDAAAASLAAARALRMRLGERPTLISLALLDDPGAPNVVA